MVKYAREPESAAAQHRQYQYVTITVHFRPAVVYQPLPGLSSLLLLLLQGAVEHVRRRIDARC